MAVAIPIIASFASASAAVAAAGSFAAAMGTVSGFLSIAGAALTTIGAVTGKKDLVKIGGFMSLGGGIGTAMNAMNAASAATEAGASSAWDMAGSAAGSDAAQFAKYAQPTAEALGEAGGYGLAEAAGSSFGPELLGDASRLGGSELQGLADRPLSQAAAERSTDYGLGTPADTAPRIAQPLSRVQEGGASLPSSELKTLLQTGWDKAGTALKGVGDFARNNKELVNLGGSMLNSMYGPEAEMIDLKKSIYERQMANLNSPIKLTYNRGRP